jgi:orotate phosphoribosyltransferase
VWRRNQKCRSGEEDQHDVVVAPELTGIRQATAGALAVLTRAAACLKVMSVTRKEPRSTVETTNFSVTNQEFGHLLVAHR